MACGGEDKIAAVMSQRKAELICKKIVGREGQTARVNAFLLLSRLLRLSFFTEFKIVAMCMSKCQQHKHNALFLCV